MDLRLLLGHSDLPCSRVMASIRSALAMVMVMAMVMAVWGSCMPSVDWSQQGQTPPQR
ncbi:hypothetical protein JGK42_000666 [Aeromonas veronii]|nr:hypothetical protein [Aeromonas veronii]